MTDTNKKRLKTDNVFLLIIISFLLLITGELIGSPISAVGILFENRIPEIFTLSSYLSTLGLWIAFIVFMLIYKPDRPILALLGKKGGNTVKNALLGLLIGAGMNGICILVSCINKDISLKYEPSAFYYLLIGFVTVFIQSGSEELMCRHFMQRHLIRGYKSPLVGILVPTFIFTMLHIFNPGITIWAILNLTLISLDLAMVAYFFDSIWMCFMVHTGWNYTQAMLFGLPNSGQVYPLHLFTIDSVRDGSRFAYDSVFGVEGSVLSCIELTLFGVIVFVLGRKHKAKLESQENQNIVENEDQNS